MRVAVLERQTPHAPASRGALSAALCDALREAGHDAASIRIPFCGRDPRTVVDQILASRLIRVDGADRVIGLAFPAYLVPHDDKVVWILEEFTPSGPAGAAADEGPARAAAAIGARRAVRNANHVHLGAARRIYARSPAAAAHLASEAGLAAAVLYPPLIDADRFGCDGYGEHIVAVASCGRERWLAAVVAALALADGLRAVVGARDGELASAAALRSLAGDLGVADRVEIRVEPLDAAARARELRGCRAAVCEAGDPCAQSVLEAFRSRRPVVALGAVGDGGGDGAAVLAGDAATGGRAGSIAALAAALTALAQDDERARACGEAGFARAESLASSWPAVVAELMR